MMTPNQVKPTVPRPPKDGRRKGESGTFAKGGRVIEEHKGKASQVLEASVAPVPNATVTGPSVAIPLLPIRNARERHHHVAGAALDDMAIHVRSRRRSRSSGTSARSSGHRRRSSSIPKSDGGVEKSILGPPTVRVTQQQQQEQQQQQQQTPPKQRVTRCKQEPSSKNRKKKIVGNYEIGSTLGEGTFGKVRKGTHTLTGETVAVKILEKSKIKTEADLIRVTREIKILKKTKHENCIRLLEVIDTPQQIFLMMEFLDGGEVFDYIVEKTRLPEQEASQFFAQIMNGVEYLHQINVIHRDLKPENLLMQRGQSEWTIKVADFGLSNMNDGNVFLKTACGSPCYAAPEMIAGKHYDGTKSDVWSLGVVLFALVCGYLPFEDNDTPTLYRKILNANYKCPSFVSLEVKDLLSKILDTNPNTRLTISGIRNHVWMRKHNSLVSAHQSNQSSNSIIEKDNTNKEPLDEDVVQYLVKECGLERDFVVRSVSTDAHNSATASYFLVSERFRRHPTTKVPEANENENENESQCLVTIPSQSTNVERQIETEQKEETNNAEPEHENPTQPLDGREDSFDSKKEDEPVSVAKVIEPNPPSQQQEQQQQHSAGVTLNPFRNVSVKSDGKGKVDQVIAATAASNTSGGPGKGRHIVESRTKPFSMTSIGKNITTKKESPFLKNKSKDVEQQHLLPVKLAPLMPPI